LSFACGGRKIPESVNFSEICKNLVLPHCLLALHENSVSESHLRLPHWCRLSSSELSRQSLSPSQM
jgi:hypothetical protein